MKKLLTQYRLNSDMQYFEIIVESFVNGQTAQAFDQFKAMSKDYRKTFIKAAIGHWHSGLNIKQIQSLIDHI